MKKETEKLSELEECRQQLKEAQAYIIELKEEIKNYTGRDRNRPHTVNGWNIQFSAGYYRMFKRIRGRMHGIYLGKVIDEDLARKKIRDRMAELEKGSKRPTKKGE
ncbi:MAG: hypothetical protein JRI73_11785 [Deltaproteobacteria bacterium]|nr:hypothetical protein [Deltaproteobacteria bacterium]